MENLKKKFLAMCKQMSLNFVGGALKIPLVLEYYFVLTNLIDKA